MRNKLSSQLYIGIFAGILVGLVVGFFIFRTSKISSPTQTEPTQTVADATTPSADECPVCPCKSWSQKILPAPEWRDEMKKNLKTSFQGQVQLRWKPVEGTRYYVLYFEDGQRKIIKTKNSGGESTFVQDIPLPEGVSEGEVTVSVAAANAKKEPGHRSEKIKLLVRAPVSTVAPMIKEIKVEE